jgi:hypothetical protein
VGDALSARNKNQAGRNKNQAGRNKTQAGRNKLKAGRNDFQIRRNKIQIRDRLFSMGYKEKTPFISFAGSARRPAHGNEQLRSGSRRRL